MMALIDPATVSMREQVCNLQREMSKLPQAELKTEHHHIEGVYCRVLHRPAGCLIVGKVHKKEHLYVVMTGRVRVTTDEGVKDVQGPCVIKSQPGTKRAVLALEDSSCMTVHRTDCTALGDIEEELIEPDDTALFDSNNRVRFDVPEFREITKRVIAAEKPGFWSDWTEEQQALYTSGDWCAFSESRGYSHQAIEDYAEWMDRISYAKHIGLNALVFIKDLAEDAALKNINLDTKEEIMKSSHAPFEVRSQS